VDLRCAAVAAGGDLTLYSFKNSRLKDGSSFADVVAKILPVPTILALDDTSNLSDFAAEAARPASSDYMAKVIETDFREFKWL
jgi:hypothetical protein